MSKSTQLTSIRNGNIDAGIGWRAIVLSLDKTKSVVSVRPMISIKDRERLSGWKASLQALTKGDFVIISSWTPNSEKMELYQYQRSDKLYPIKNLQLLDRLLRKLHKSLVDFLKPVDGGPSYLPSGYWRRKYDMVEMHTAEQIENFLPKDMPAPWFEYIVQEASKSPAAHLNLDWNNHQVKELPDKLTNHTESWYDEDTDEDFINNSMVWLLFLSGGTKILIEPEPTSGNMYVGPSKRIVSTYRAIAKKMPANVVKAIQFNIGAYERDNRSYGCRWYLYKRSK